MKESIPNCCGNYDRAKKVSKKIVTEVYCNKYQQKMFVIGNCSDWIPGRHRDLSRFFYFWKNLKGWFNERCSYN